MIQKLKLCFVSALIFSHFFGIAQKTVSIIGVGDIMMGTNYPESPAGAYLPADSGKQLFSDVTPYFKTADIVFGNLEGVLLNSGGTPKSCSNPNICYAFRMPEYNLKNLTNAGFNLINMANNHVHDFGRDAALNAYTLLTNANINVAGLEGKCEYSIFKQEDITFGFMGLAPNTGTVRLNNYEKIKEILKLLSSKCDIVIVSFHGGAEGASHNRVTKQRETFLGEDRGNVYELAHLCIDNGADIVFGHGPHVPRAMELYKERFIAYSLGNFCTPYRVNTNGNGGYAPIVKVVTDTKGKFISGELKSCVQNERIGPRYDAEKICVKEIKKLSELDFPNGELNISDDGILSKKEKK
jgi:poly-gamma-glutamate capsule biosynthesis protein CapA/YwtB (metallophosphatase superfamily)